MRTFHHSGVSSFLATMACALALGGVPGAHALTIDFLNPEYHATNFATLGIDTRAIALDAGLNIYAANTNQDGGAEFRISKRIPPGYTNAAATTFAAYASTPSFGVTGVDFDPGGVLYASELDAGGNTGRIRKVDDASVVVELTDFRPTGVHASGGDLFYVGGRKESDPDFGNVYSVLGAGAPVIVISGIVPTGVTLDAAGNIYVSTRQTDFGGFTGRSIYRFDAVNAFSSPVLVATFSGDNLDELAFDHLGRLYVAEINPSPDVDATHIIQLARVPEPGALFLVALGLFMLTLVCRHRLVRSIRK